MDRESHGFLGEFAERLVLARDYTEAFKVFEIFVQSLGYAGVLYTYIPRIVLERNHLKQPIYSASSDYNPDYISHYMEARFDLNDPIVKAIDSGELKVLDWWGEVGKGYMSSSERNVIEVAREDYQIINGFTIPFLSSTEGIAGASFISDAKDRQYQLLRDSNKETLKIGAHLFHAAVMSSSWRQTQFVIPALGVLNPLERKILHGLATGLKAKQIADKSGKSQKYIEKVLRQLKFKLAGTSENGRPEIETTELIYHLGLTNLLAK